LIAQPMVAGVRGDEVPGQDAPTLAVATYWNLILKHRWGIIGLAVVSGLMAALVAYSLEPVYRAEATLLLDSKRKGFSPVNQEQGDAGWMSYFDSQNFMQTQILLIKSRALAESVVDRLKLWEHPDFDSRQVKPRRARVQFDWRAWFSDILPAAEPAAVPTEAEARAQAVAAVVGQVKVESVPDSDMLRLGFSAHDPTLAARVANAYADAYVEMGLETRLQAVSKAATWLTGRLEGMREKVEASERKLQAFREAEGLVDMQGALDLVDKQLSGLADRVVEARTKRDDLEGLFAQIQRAEKLSSAELAAHPTLARNSTIQALKASELQAEREVSELAKRYGPQHPKMVAARTDLETVRAKLGTEVGNAMAGVRKELDIARGQAQKLEAELAATKTNAQDANRQEFTLRALKRDVESDRQLYDLFLTRFKETNLGADVESTNARIIDAAMVPVAPVEPQIRRIVIVVTLLALLLGVGLAFLMEYLDNTLKSGQDVEEALLLPLLGTVPLLSARRRRRSLPERTFLDQPKSEFAEAVRTVRTGVVLSSIDAPYHVILVTSSVPGEGKTTLAINLAVALGHLDRVLLIDADMRRSSVGSKFGLPADAPGLSSLVAGTADEAACIHHVEDVGIDVMPAGLIPPNPLELLSSRRFAETLDALRGRYDRIVLDSAPAQAVSDSLILSKACDAVVFVVRSDETPVPLVQVAVKRLRQVGAPLIGAVLNQYDSKRGARYGHYHYGKYRRYSYSYNTYANYYHGKD
jgi:polysaccharide biosynthesis transport protein